MPQVDINLRDLYRVVRKHKWVVAFSPILMGFATFWFTEIPAPIYNAQALLRITRSSTVAGLMTDLISFSEYDNMATQITVVTSQPVLQEVAYRMNLAKRGEDAQDAINALKGLISAEQQGGSDILIVRSQGPSEQAAVTLVNTVVDVYIDRYKSERDRRLNETVQFIRERMRDATQEMTESESALGDFRRNNAIVLSLSANQGLELQEKLTQQRQKAADLLASIEALVRIQESREYESLLQTYLLIEDAGARSLADEVTRKGGIVADLRSKKSDLLRFQTEAAPQVQAINHQLGSEERRLESLMTNLIRRLRGVSVDQERLAQATARQLAGLDRQPEAVAQLAMLEAVAREKQELNAALRKQLQEGEIQQKERADEINVVEEARTASTVPQPGRTYKTIIGAIIGILIGGVFAFVLESMDTSIGTIEDVEHYVNSVVLGVIPHLEPEDIKSRIGRDQFPQGITDDDVSRFARLTTHFDPKSVPSEAYRTLRTNVASIMAKNNKKMLLLSSSVIQEGKTTSCCNLATAFAQTGKKTLLIDADLRRPTVDKVFGVERHPGLTDVLLGTRDLKECYRTIDDVILGKYGLRLARMTPGLEYLHILPAGRLVDNPTELLNTPMLDRLMTEMRRDFDIVIFDVSPILPVADAFVLAPKVDGVILAYQIGRVARDILKRTKMRVESLGGNVWGIIMNDIQAEIDYKQADFQYYHYRYESASQAPLTFGERVKSFISGRSKIVRRRVRRSAEARQSPPPPPAQSGLTPPSEPPSPPASTGRSSPATTATAVATEEPPEDRSKNHELRDIMSLTDEDEEE